ncbi:hypothetical protein [Nostoc commune]|uniref:hypothetical protein n=1 Tax=Nostoc commune TaxID=1178 RepID=UPI002072C24E|nr:hypothetical protein [Nostoc commune]
MTKYRDTRGVVVDEYNKVFDVIDTTAPRESGIMLYFCCFGQMFCGGGEVAKLMVGDFDYHDLTLIIMARVRAMILLGLT